jgi:Ca2+-binding EF-hand superfamily protein
MNSFGENILSRLRILVQQSGKSLDEIFNQFDTDGSGELTKGEFRKALRSMNLGLTILEINEIITLVDKKDLKGHSRYDKVEGDSKI